MIKRFARIGVSMFVKQFGWELVPQRDVRKFLPEAYFTAFLQDNHITTVFDVGANRGQFRDMCRKAGFKGRIISFEPATDLFTNLKAKKEDDVLWEIHNFALGRKEGNQQFNLMEESVFNSFLEPSHSAVDDYLEKNVIKEKQEVKISTLDNFVRDSSIKIDLNKTLLKIDTQG
ncbi:FkbM family methyltransferase [Hwanghaeella sp.]|uniref:FkbM family methyltransferase n=1 Tax=Hwanghaeella sp. TaxID=2605943 RepID=UPI003CCB7E96